VSTGQWSTRCSPGPQRDTANAPISATTRSSTPAIRLGWSWKDRGAERLHDFSPCPRGDPNERGDNPRVCDSGRAISSNGCDRSRRLTQSTPSWGAGVDDARAHHSGGSQRVARADLSVGHRSLGVGLRSRENSPPGLVATQLGRPAHRDRHRRSRLRAALSRGDHLHDDRALGSQESGITCVTSPIRIGSGWRSVSRSNLSSAVRFPQGRDPRRAGHRRRVVRGSGGSASRPATRPSGTAS
jgi:hypothetical protein